MRARGCAGWRPTCPALGRPSLPASAGVSEAPFDSLNLGALTDDDACPCDSESPPSGRGLGLEAERVLAGRQVHGAELALPHGPAEAEPVRRAWKRRTARGRRSRDCRARTRRPGLRGRLPADRAGGSRRRRDASLRLAGSGGGDRRPGRRGGRRDRTPRSDPGSAPAAMRSARRCSTPLPGCGEGVAAGRMLDLPEVARRLLREAGVERRSSPPGSARAARRSCSSPTAATPAGPGARQGSSGSTAGAA